MTRIVLLVAVLAMTGCGGGHWPYSTVTVRDLGCDADMHMHAYTEETYGDWRPLTRPTYTDDGMMHVEFNCFFDSAAYGNVAHQEDCYMYGTRFEDDAACLPIPKELR